jgi:archaellum biogenesis protein FlaJ (TadC family)
MTGGEDATQILTRATSLPPVSVTTWQHVIVSLLWFALSAQWMTVVPIIVPDQVAVILGGDSAAKEAISGIILAAGAVVALVVAPLSGALSDRSQHRHGRRRLFLIAGVLGSCVGLLLLGRRCLRGPYPGRYSRTRTGSRKRLAEHPVGRWDRGR